MFRINLTPWQVLVCVQSVSRETPRIDRGRIEAAVARYLRRNRMPSLLVRFAKDAEDGYVLAHGRAELDRWAPARREEHEGAARRKPEPSMLAVYGRAVEAVWHPAETVVRRMAEGRAWNRIARDVPPSAPVPWLAPRTAASLVRQVAGFSLAVHVTDQRGDRTAVRRALWQWAPMLEAFQHGLWLLWLLEDEVVAVTRPQLKIEGGQLHASDGPAVYWPPGSGYYFLRGVNVPYDVVMKPGSLTSARILRERNVEVQRVMLERYGGYARVLREVEAVPVDSSRFGTLYRVSVRGSEPLTLVRVVNATAEADGRRREYLLRVRPDVRTAREAVAWTFGMEAEEYDPVVES